MSTRLTAGLGATVGVALSLWAGQAHAIKIGGENMNSWAGCASSQNTLSYTDDQISLWLAKMQGLGHTRKFWYSDSLVWASDLVEDDWGGQDNLYADAVDFYALSSHGGAGTDANGYQYWWTPTCSAGSFTTANPKSWDTSWDESLPNPLATPNVGWARFIMLMTCFSIDTKPNDQWAWPVSYGNDVIMGYKGLSADSSTTDEVGEDLGEAVFNDGDTFRAGWFWAIEDWSVDDTGGILFGGVDSAQCSTRRSGLKPSWARRTDVEFFWFCWSHHEG
jgi:uncharacterized protein DUF6345